MERKRILISEDKVGIATSLGIIKNKIIPLLENIDKSVRILRAGGFTTDLLDAIQSNDIDLVREALYNRIKGLLNGNIMDETVIRQAYPKVEAIIEVVLKLFDLNELDLLDCVSFNDGSFSIKEESTEAIKEENRIYVYSSKGKQLYEAHKEAAEALNRFYSLAKDNIFGEIQGLLDKFEIEDGNIIPTSEDYEAYTYSKNKKEKVSE